ncbi:MAG: tRNA lysidine(34) synthetase TilS [Pirellulales bacterium]|nr:tRNA lysidine(34) synthetase TilS [Pirellulales bacterium]
MHPLESKLIDSWPPGDWADVTVLAAVSGGCDSVALLRAMTAVRSAGEGRIVAAHLDHGLRPDADEDRQFVVELCGRLQIDCEAERIDVGREAQRRGEGVEAAARRCRYRFLKTAAEKFGARFVVTAHTADDQVETILHRIVRGTGVRGLSGMARTRRLGHASLVRPLLGIRREELLAYLRDLGQTYRVDASNADRRFTRNRIRLELLPRLRRRFNPEIDAALLRLGAIAGRSQAVIDRLVEERFEQCVVIENKDAVAVDLGVLVDWPPHLVRELFMAVWRRRQWPLQPMGMAQWEELARLAAAGADARRDLPGGVTAEIASGKIRLRRPSPFSLREMGRR